MTPATTRTVSGQGKPSAREAFDANMADAEMLVALATMLQNKRQRRMRAELRERVGEALSIPKRKRAELECLENDQVFVAFKPGATGLRGELNELALRPLLRQAVVAACAAVETFVADRVIENFSRAMKMDPIPPRLLGLTMTVDDWLRIERTYTRKGFGIRQIAELEIRERSSPTPSVIGELFSMVGIKDIFKSIDTQRKVVKGTSTTQLDLIRQRRNKIAHEGDRKGRSRAAISVAEVESYLSQVREIIDAMDKVTRPTDK
jgi:hypothetical protein